MPPLERVTFEYSMVSIRARLISRAMRQQVAAGMAVGMFQSAPG